MNFSLVQRLVTVCCKQSISITTCRKYGIIVASVQSKQTILLRKQNKKFFFTQQQLISNVCAYSTKTKAAEIENNISSLQVKKRTGRKKRSVVQAGKVPLPGVWSVKAVATAEEYNLETLVIGLLDQGLYAPKDVCRSKNCFPDVVHAIARYDVDQEPREIFFFREGTAVLWNIPDVECENILQFLKSYEENSYHEELVSAESELMSYTYAESGRRCQLKEGSILLTPSSNDTHKFTFSNAMSQSVKLGIWEAWLDHYVDTMKYVTQDLRTGSRLRISQQQVLQRQGELFALRHLINLSSDLLDTPDFYWERDDLESLYQQTCGYFSIAKRTRVMNEKLNHCLELVAILSTHLSDRHHIRLEWMIIILIMVEVAFEIVHYIDRYLVK